MIEIKGLCKAFGEKRVLQEYSACWREPVVLMAPSGSGKTTLLRILMSLERADSGAFSGVGRVAAVFQEDRLCPQLTAEQNIRLVLPKKSEAPVGQELLALGFEPADLATPAGRLSGGQKRRVALLRALLCPADTLLLDEPFTGLDEALVRRAAEAIARHTGGRNAVLVTHDAAAAALLGWPVQPL